MPILLAGSLALIGSFFPMNGDDEDPEIKIKQQVYDACFQKFERSSEEIFSRICENIAEVFYSQFKSANKVIEQAIFIYENILEQEEKSHPETQEKLELKQKKIAEKKQQFILIKNYIQTIIN